MTPLRAALVLAVLLAPSAGAMDGPQFQGAGARMGWEEGIAGVWTTNGGAAARYNVTSGTVTVTVCVVLASQALPGSCPAVPVSV